MQKLCFLIGACACSFSVVAAPAKRVLSDGVAQAVSPIESGENGIATEKEAGAGENDVVTVKGTGAGETEEVALKDAYRDAVETAVGLYVDAEQMAQNEEMIQDEILTQSNAYIENYKEVSRKSENGLIKIKILATVKKQALTKKIKGTMKPKSFKLGGGLKKYHAQTTTQAKKSADGAALLARALEGIDLKRQLIDVSLASADVVPAQDLSSNRGRKHDKSKNIDASIEEMAYLFKFEINRDRYFNQFLPKLMQVLEQVSESEPVSVSFNVADVRRAEYETVRAYSDPKARFQSPRGSSSFGRLLVGVSQDPKVLSVPGEGEISTGTSVRWGEALDVVVISEANPSMTLVKGKKYSLSPDVANEIGKWLSGGKNVNRMGSCYSIDRGARYAKLRYQVSFLDEAGKELSTSTIELGDNYVDQEYLENSGLGSWRNRTNRKDTKIWFVTPYMGCTSPSFYKWFAFKLQKEELPKIDSIKIELVH